MIFVAKVNNIFQAYYLKFKRVGWDLQGKNVYLDWTKNYFNSTQNVWKYDKDKIGICHNRKDCFQQQAVWYNTAMLERSEAYSVSQNKGSPNWWFLFWTTYNSHPKKDYY